MTNLEKLIKERNQASADFAVKNQALKDYVKPILEAYLGHEVSGEVFFVRVNDEDTVLIDILHVSRGDISEYTYDIPLLRFK